MCVELVSSQHMTIKQHPTWQLRHLPCTPVHSINTAAIPGFKGSKSKHDVKGAASTASTASMDWLSHCPASALLSGISVIRFFMGLFFMSLSTFCLGRFSLSWATWGLLVMNVQTASTPTAWFRWSRHFVLLFSRIFEEPSSRLLSYLYLYHSLNAKLPVLSYVAVLSPLE